MADPLRFDDKVVVVTGAGGGLGRCHALLFGARGAKVVVNDLGGSMSGEGKSAKAADMVVDEIKSAGGEAAPSYDSVEEGDKIIQAALDHFGRVDVVVNNAGILRDVSFHKMTPEDWDLVYRVHVKGSFAVTHAAWPHMREQGYGRVLMTASAAGIYGNFGQANYSMAKLGLVGLSNTLAVEGLKRNIQVNTIAPVAGSRLTETVFPPELVEALKPEYVSPLVAWLCHEDCDETGGLFEVGGGFFGKVRWERSAGKMIKLGRDISPELVKNGWDDITSFDTSTHPHEVMQSFEPIMANVNAGPSKGGNEYIDVDEALGYEYPPVKSRYDERDLALYALGVGAASDPTLDRDLQLVYEMHGEGFHALPTFGVIPAINAVVLENAKKGITPPGFNYGLERVLHGEQVTEVTRPLPPQAELTHKARIVDIFDKGKNALIVTEIDSFDDDGDLLVKNRFTALVRGVGGWGGERGPDDTTADAPDRAPDAVVEENIGANQALLYRLSGDWNPLHADPNMASAFGFQKPILHGLCTYGYVARHVINQFLGGDPRRFKRIGVRFADSVYPGETLVTEMWKESDDRIIVRAKVKERDSEVITKAFVEMYDAIPEKKASPTSKAAPADGAAPSEPISADIFVAIGKFLEQNAGLSDKIKTTYQFKLSDPSSTWTVDLNAKPGAVAQGETKKPECTLELSDRDFMDMCTGKADAQQLYFGGALKIGGNLMASQKLEFLKKIDPQLVVDAMTARGASEGGASPEAGSSSSGGGASEQVFEAIAGYIQNHPELCDEVAKVFCFELKAPDATWTIDVKNAPGSCHAGNEPQADCTLVLSDADFLDMTSGKADPQQLYLGGSLKISGDLMASQKLRFLQKVKDEVGGAKPKEPVAQKAFDALGARLKENDNLANEVDATIAFHVTEPDSAWTVDLKGKGAVKEGTNGASDAAITLSEEALAALIRGEASAESLYQRGEMRVDGDVRIAQRLAFLKNLI